MSSCRWFIFLLVDPEEYELPFQYKVPADPSFDDMREAVVLKGLIPEIPERWTEDEVMYCVVCVCLSISVCL